MKILISQGYYSSKKVCWYLFSYIYDENGEFVTSKRLDEKKFYKELGIESKTNMHGARYAICSLETIKAALENNGHSIVSIQSF